ncbi:unnamed protein product [Triticum turgidum subsp. durum]|uniref:F-box domain-containing protein n=1 Tax=Triticum turgidum subsp. durum TaxID=4567 RepID=A0A9R1QYJ0_TRITD|nr:unnamed protein product [Triticum turgidum subsp. durum]
MLGQFNMDSEAMSTCKKARAEATSVVSSDRLSSLPPEIKGGILSHLNVKEAVRTSILSSTWRDAWANMPEISLREGNFTRTKFITLVDMVLLLHKGTIEDFDISGDKSYHDEFGRWMLMLSRRSPRPVIIKLNSGPWYRIPSYLFSIGDLESLDLENCIISLFQGFKSLTDLSLENSSSRDMDIQTLISSCPVLTDLILTSVEGINCLNIRAPKLEFLNVEGEFEDIKLDAPNLEVAIFSLDHKAKACQSVPIAHDKESYVKQLLGSLSDVKTLSISGSVFRKYLTKGCILMKFRVVFHRLENIYLGIYIWDQRQVSATCSLLKNAPNLKMLELWSYPRNTWEHYQDQASIKELTLEMQMDHLVMANVKHFGGLDYEVDFVAKLLSWAPALEEVKLEWNGKTDRSMVLTKLLALPRVSPTAKIIVT